MLYDVIVVGAGIAGAFVARELSKYELNVCLTDKESDVSLGTSKANSAIIHAGYDSTPGSLKAQLAVRGNKLMKKAVHELNVPFRETGSLVICFNESDLPRLEELKGKGKANGVEGLEIVSGNRLRDMEPNLAGNVAAALYAPSAWIVCPYELTLHAVENAVENGVSTKLDCEVKGIRYIDGFFFLLTTIGELRCRYLVNAAGLFSDEISRMAGDGSFDIHPRKGEYALLDKRYGGLVSHVVFQLPTENGKGVLVTPTVDGNLLLGPNAHEVPDKGDLSTTDAGLAEVFKTAGLSVGNIDLRGVITSFSGLRASTKAGDFIIRPSGINNRLIHVAGIDSPGLTSAPAIGERVVELLEANGLKLVERKSFNPVHEGIARASRMNEDELNEMIKRNPGYGRIVCRCEKVTEADVVACIRQTVGARDLDAVKRRTRAGMGRCQGGFCSPRIVEILSRELGLPMEQITKSGGKSYILAGRTRYPDGKD